MESGSNRIVIRKTQPAFSKEQKLGFALVIGVGFLAFVMGGFYIGAHLTDAFDIEYDGPAIMTVEQQQAKALLDLQTSDTDGDSFSDYEELYLYRTSPYLTDTDGDGTDDATEVAQGTDPNCAPGAACSSVENDAFGSSGTVVTPQFETPGGEVLQENLDLLDAFTEDVSAEDVRQFLIEGGISEEQVNALSDDEVIQLYESVIVDLNNSGELESLVQPAQ